MVLSAFCWSFVLENKTELLGLGYRYSVFGRLACCVVSPTRRTVGTRRQERKTLDLRTGKQEKTLERRAVLVLVLFDEMRLMINSYSVRREDHVR